MISPRVRETLLSDLVYPCINLFLPKQVRIGNDLSTVLIRYKPPISPIHLATIGQLDKFEEQW